MGKKVTSEEACRILGIRRNTFHKRVSEGIFPKGEEIEKPKRRHPKQIWDIDALIPIHHRIELQKKNRKSRKGLRQTLLDRLREGNFSQPTIEDVLRDDMLWPDSYATHKKRGWYLSYEIVKHSPHIPAKIIELRKSGKLVSEISYLIEAELPSPVGYEFLKCRVLHVLESLPRNYRHCRDPIDYGDHANDVHDHRTRWG